MQNKVLAMTHFERPFWVKKIKDCWKKRPIVWLSGVRQVGKTTLSKMFDGSVYLNCDLPSVARQIEDPESFYDELDEGTIIIFDEVHRIQDPSLLLKIGADNYPHLKILATGSSTLAAVKKFRDTLTGRKYSIYLPPVLINETKEVFNIKNLNHRLLLGGLPESLLSDKKDPDFFSEWIDSFYARDIQELFEIRNRTGFLKLFQLLLRQSGSMIQYTNLAKLCGLSRPTVKSHIEAMCIANAVFLLTPFHGGGRREITKSPKIYTFDTGFITYAKGWDKIRDDDKGILWEHLVLDTLRSFNHDSILFYWRDKSNREIDFIIKRAENNVDTIECKVNVEHFNPDSIKTFRLLYPKGQNYIVSPHVKTSYTRKFGNVFVKFTSINDLYMG